MNMPLHFGIRGKIGMRARDIIARPDAETIKGLARYGADLVADIASGGPDAVIAAVEKRFN